MKDTFLYFSDLPSGTVELCGSCDLMPLTACAELFPGVKPMRESGMAKVSPAKENGTWKQVFPVTRIIRYKKCPSKHECNAKCMGGKPNGTCECSCGGKNHGRSGFMVCK